MNPNAPHETPPLKSGWKTLAIGRHLVDLPGDAKLHQIWRYNDAKIERLPVRSDAEFQRTVDAREAALKALPPQVKHGSRFVARHRLSQGSELLISWAKTSNDLFLLFDAFFRTADGTVLYSAEGDSDRMQAVVENRNRLSQEWRAIPDGQIPSGTGFVAGDMLLAANRFNPESWELSIELAGKPDVRFQVKAYAHSRTKPESLRDRAGGALAGLLGTIAGLTQLRNRRRSVGPIEADEILVAGNQDGKRSYGFKWEAPGKGGSLAEPNLNVSLEVSESAYKTNAQSFANDQEALELWDTVVESIRLRPGAAG